MSSGTVTSSVVNQFVLDAREDLVSPTTSAFHNRLHSYRQHAQLIQENLDFDLEGLQKFRKSVKSLHETGLLWHESEGELVSALDALANVNAANSLAQDYDPEISAAWLKFCVIFNDLSKLTKGLVQSVKNNLLFPVENLLKTDLKDKAELKRPVDKALREFDGKLARLEKEVKQNSREGANGRVYLSSTDLAEAVLKERTVVETEMCKYFDSVSKIQSKKGSELLQHLIAFYHTQESFYREGLRTVEEFRCYVETLIERLNEINRRQEEERKELRKLSELLDTAPCLKESADKVTQHHVGGGQYVQDMNLCGQSDNISGYLYKKSSKRMHRHWMKRKCRVSQDIFYIYHSNETYPPRAISLLTCRVIPHKDEPKEFYVVSYERKYQFQAEDQASARHWVTVLKRNQGALQVSIFHSNQPTVPSSRTGMDGDETWSKRAVDKIRSLPGNDRCCDCDAVTDVTWVSTNLGSLHCIECSGAHRDLGCHVSRIQSLTLDNLDKTSLLIPLSMGNTAVNRIYQATRNKLSRTSSGNLRKSYISEKYSEKRYVRKLDEGDSLEWYAHNAVLTGSVEKTVHALALGADVNSALGNEGLLFTAVRQDSDGSHLTCLHSLVQNGADVNGLNGDGDTPIHLAVRLDKPECLKLLLLSRHARLQSSHASLVDLAHRSGRTACGTVLRADRSALTDIAIPSSLLPLDSDQTSFTSSALTLADSSPGLHRTPPPLPPPRKHTAGVGSKRMEKRCRALYDCQADRPDELSFNMNDVIVVTRDKLSDEDSNWMEGYLEGGRGGIGVFPVTFVTFET